MEMSLDAEITVPSKTPPCTETPSSVILRLTESAVQKTPSSAILSLAKSAAPKHH